MEFIQANANWLYLVGAILFILTLRGLSGPKTAIQGNRYGMIAMAIAVVTTFFVANNPVIWMIVGAMVLGAIVGVACTYSAYDANAGNCCAYALISGFGCGINCDCCNFT